MLRILKNTSFATQIMVTFSAIMLIPILVMVYDIFFSGVKDEMLLKTKEERLGTMVNATIQGLNESLQRWNAEFHSPLTPEDTRLIANAFEVAKPLADANPGVRLGLYIPETNDLFVYGFLHQYRPQTPEEIKARENRVLDEASSGLVAVNATKKPLSRITGSLGNQTFEYLMPVVEGERLVAIAWADEQVHPVFAQSRQFSIIARCLTLLGLILGLGAALYVIHNLANEVQIIKNGILSMQEDSEKRLPSLPGEIGEVVQAINTMADNLKEKKRLEEELMRSERLVALGRLVTGIAHELRNPLGIVKATVQVMEGEFKSQPDLQEYTQVICEQVDRGNRVIKELLDFGRPSKPIVSPVNLNSLLESVLTFTYPMLRQNKIELEKKFEPGLPMLNIDMDRIKQVFVNLILNSIQAMHGGGKLIIQSVDCKDTIDVHFIDSGSGINPQDLPHVFDPFYTTKDDGAGLGLSICYQIIQMHRGKIWVSDTSPSGTTMTVSLPKSNLVLEII
ncbi:signal transduction histidine kinase, nitrogen specific [Desulfosporosinus orientis DSM 765]|uniref:histidine kinase n=1 Tax=Desulfosporosinus orientis (strain ATCC 19365 / DSM 765 / NCIMB 8382 / VKM B-1628 / Singapore I) TaxID=768706 RepID=G7WF71_DESOD|nr:ATP-binding protein [Desulfosporosinus orientis]AET67682.1 signal transduction histidine kinase, nitrogen specific [Desulfosporosinus orientis DSM 765]